jgi:catechol 2,3-dioxygenase-like lactoylglutathione lyase family enzyme
MTPHLRVARATDHLEEILRFYSDGLGFIILGQFQNHAGFDGIMLGHPDQQYHLEFTTQHGHTVGRAPTQENLLVFYIPERSAWERAVQQMRTQGFESVPSHNPYWDQAGKTFEDSDGYRVVLQNGAWE